MSFSHRDQTSFTYLALALFDRERKNEESIEHLLAVGELVKKYADADNTQIYDLTEYLYEQLRLLRKEDGAYDPTELREQLEKRE
ncbi:hypothetical protein P5V90_06690 [Mycobacteroides abscessus subsp. abscessus]|uniref:hypothetical protein n=1 Tax=Mycobacteroides abscessus TaxID=36809 RepID=UPI00266C4B12|nr:hypothetical protein [Mycobacteroides abscessus]MDO3166642.1 hypothetical protein [Mycobacteroides abscessus subsp. abscessus]